MPEVLVVLVTLAAIGVLGLVTHFFTPPLMTAIGLWMLAVGLGAGVPAGIRYHHLLYRTLSRSSRLPAGWWVRPTSLHGRLSSTDLPRIRWWFRLGGLGFLLSVTGGLAATAGLLMTNRP